MKNIFFIIFLVLVSCSANYKDKVAKILYIAQTESELSHKEIKKILTLHNEVIDSVLECNDTIQVIKYCDLLVNIFKKGFYSYNDSLLLKAEISLIERVIPYINDKNDYMRLCSQLIGAYTNNGQFTQVEKLVVNSFKFVEEEFGSNSFNMATLYYITAYVVQKQGNLEMALKLYNKSASIYKEVIIMATDVLDHADLTQEQIKSVKKVIEDAKKSLSDCEEAISKAPEECAKNFAEVAKLTNNYENKWLTFNYPKNWKMHEEINPFNDTIPITKEGMSIYVGQILTTFVPAVYIVKSCMPATFDTPEQWRDLSIALKSIGDENYQILSVVDSVDFNGNPAALAIFQYNSPETNDTIIQVQYCVLRTNNDVFYINKQFHPNDSLNMNLCQDIIESIQFK